MITTDLSPGNSAGLYEIPFEYWESINKRVFEILSGGIGGGKYYAYSTLSNFQKLWDGCEEWKHTTFPGLITLGNMINSFIDNTFAANFTTLQNIIDELGKGNTEVSIQKNFTRVMTAIKENLDKLDNQTTPLANQITQFGKINRQADDYYIKTFPDIGWEELKPNPSVVDDAINGIRGVFGAISAKVTKLQEQFDESMSKDSLFIMDIGLDASLHRWLRVKDAIKIFLSNSGQQQKYLNGFWNYDDPKIDENSWYTLSNRLLGNNTFLEVNTQRGNNYPVMHDGGEMFMAHWRFTRIGAGWYKLSNRFLSDDRILISELEWKLDMKHQSFTSADYWKFTPLGDDWYRLTNYRSGDKLFLDTDINDKMNRAFLTDDSSSHGTYWKIHHFVS